MTAAYARSRQRIRAELDAIVAEAIRDLYLREFRVSIKGVDTLKVEMLVVQHDARRNGYGSDAMRRLTRYADANWYRIVLVPATDEDRDLIGTTNRDALHRFYWRLGFRENDGEDRTIEHSAMVREPRPEVRP